MNNSNIYMNETTYTSDIISKVVDINTSFSEKQSSPPNLSHGYSLLSLLLLLFVISGGLGNTLVCLAICRERRLQNVTNYFLLSLAMADLLVCLAVMPFGIVDLFFGYWPFGPSMCNIWVTCDVLGCTSSIIHMCFISLGRYLGIRSPLKTRKNSKKKVTIKIAIAWLISMTITSPITVLGFTDTENIQPTTQMCAINNRFFFVFGSLSAFYIPMFIMVTSYILTVRLLRQKAKFCEERPGRKVSFIRRARRHLLQDNPHKSETSNIECNKCDRCATRRSRDNNNENTILEDSQANSRANYGCFRESLKKRSHIKFKETSGIVYTLRCRSHMQVMNEQKATQVLGIVFFCFITCWTPFFALNILFPIIDPTSFPEYLTTTFLWLGYVSSTINPIIYTIFNKAFRRAFWRLLSCSCCLYNMRSPTINELVMWPTKSKHFVNIITTRRLISEGQFKG
ncbi:5-hydroxytryptamine receptor 2C-like isoform X1 [Limulus polyphemus]|uniref:5-hydroxytryptamine receptor 2C-like isoform X1 n=2 Tax=Limulus polyphemus TaxID=6850 RepID=A0ABM1S0Z8_LIMPO|nr:5-hydroxytryptamine receptor 2C-like isoform X1 [Limulus polyphemus]